MQNDDYTEGQLKALGKCNISVILHQLTYLSL